jgi:endogenous inhibitor of DNA gyrase (YacG/DUF329 family)
VSLCPICQKEAAPRAKNKAFPFCSTRCRQVDLGKWLDEEYRVTAIDTPAPTDADESPGASSRPTSTK